MLFGSLDGRCQSDTYLLNDSTVCTSITNVQKTAQRVLILEEQLEYLKEHINEDLANYDELLRLEFELKKAKKKIFWGKIKTPTFSILSFLTGFVLHNLVTA